MFSHRVFLASGLGLLSLSFLSAQSIVSARSGVVHFFEGAVSVDGQPLEAKFGKFYNIAAGSELRTDQGRAEVLLTPGVFLRVDQNSSIRMVSTRLGDTCVEFIGGSAILDSAHAGQGAPVAITYRTYRVRFTKPGNYRLDSAPAKLKVETGEAEVSSKNRSVEVLSGEVLPFAPSLAKFVTPAATDDGLEDWAKERSTTITASNASANASDDLTAALNNPQAGSYDAGAYPYPVLTPGPYLGAGSIGVSPYGLGSPYSLYGAPGFGYGYIPLYLRAPAYRPLFPARMGTFSPSVNWHPVGRTASPGYRAPAMAPHPMPHPVGRGAHR